MEDFVDVAVENSQGVKRKAEESGLGAQAPKKIKVEMIEHYDRQKVPLTCSGP